MQNDENKHGTSGRDLCGADGNDNRRRVSVRFVRNPDRHGADANPSDSPNPGNGPNPARMRPVRTLPQYVQPVHVRGRPTCYEARVTHPATKRHIYLGRFDSPDVAGAVAAEAVARYRAEAERAGVRRQRDCGVVMRLRKHRGRFGNIPRPDSVIRGGLIAHDSGKHAQRMALIEPWIDRIDAISDVDVEDAYDALRRMAAEIPVEVRRACLAVPYGLDPMVGLRILLGANRDMLQMQDIADLYGLSRQRIEQIEVRAYLLCELPLRGWEDHIPTSHEHALADCGTGEE